MKEGKGIGEKGRQGKGRESGSKGGGMVEDVCL